MEPDCAEPGNHQHTELEKRERERERERERSTREDRVFFSSVGLWEGFLGVKITWIPYHSTELPVSD